MKNDSKVVIFADIGKRDMAEVGVERQMTE